MTQPVTFPKRWRVRFRNAGAAVRNGTAAPPEGDAAVLGVAGPTAGCTHSEALAARTDTQKVIPRLAKAVRTRFAAVAPSRASALL